MMDTQTGRILWYQLHCAADNNMIAQKGFIPVWLDRVKFNLGCTSCYKKLEWFMSKWPPEYGKGFDLWVTCLHDYMNKELGKPLFAPHLTLEPLTQKGIIQ